ncbi:MAG: CDP-glucose 4,6-dehydratase [Planctomycetaceae bacterium]
MTASRLSAAFAGRRVLLTGHTGFKGAWLAEWLLGMGAEVTGYALDPPTQPALFDQLGLAGRLRHVVADIRDAAAVERTVKDTRPEFIFHLAAQSLVRESYAHPVDTFSTNVMGTISVLEAARRLEQPCAVVVVTTDKCYANREWHYGYREEDPLGGRDPYSASKAATELAAAAWRASYFGTSPVRIATARAGNVIGGGDWAKDRIVPDCMRALAAGRSIPVRNSRATRPWQHVLEPLAGYLWLAACLASSERISGDSSLESGFNFGPGSESNRPVGDLVERVLIHWPGSWTDATDASAPHEARFLHLCTDKAAAVLHWRPVWSFDDTIRETVAWYRLAAADVATVGGVTRRQICEYCAAAAGTGLAWAAPA